MTRTDSKPVAPFTAAVGQALAEIRRAAGITQDTLAGHARSLGLGWTRSSVASLETGVRQLDSEELLALPLVLSAALGRPVSVLELLDGLPRVVFVGAMTFPADLIRSVLRGEPQAASLAAGQQPDGPAMDAYRPYWPTASTGQLFDALIDAGEEATQKAARRLGVPAEAVSVLAHRLWGRGVTLEREMRVAAQSEDKPAPRRLQALRGHVTRGLLSELAAALEKWRP